MVRYQTPLDPAPNIESLLDCLRQAEVDEPYRKFAYRGQTRDYNGPLLPSGYRRFYEPGQMYAVGGGVPHYFGKTFVRVDSPLGLRQMITHWIKKDPQPSRVLLNIVVDDSLIDQILEKAGVFAPFGDYRHSEIAPLFEDQDDEQLAPLIDFVHRQVIRLMAGELMFGSPVSEFLSQQYGLSSGYLDASLSMQVAAFFALYESPLFMKPVSFDSCGVIHRFDITEAWLSTEAPTLKDGGAFALLGERIFGQFEEEHVNYRDVKGILTDFYLQAVFQGNRQLQSLKVPKGSLSMSRIGRQHSVMLIPGLVIVEDKESIATLALEDLKSRPGFNAFYFKHTGMPGFELGLSRSWLWPRIGDVFKQWIRFHLGSDTAGMVSSIDDSNKLVALPKRFDLIDIGYKFDDAIDAEMNRISSKYAARRTKKKVSEEGAKNLEELEKITMDCWELLKRNDFGWGSIRFVKKSERQLKKAGYPRGLTMCKLYTALMLSNRGKSEDASRFAKEAIRDALSLNDKEDIEIKSLAAYLVGAIHIQNGLYMDALTNCLMAVELSEQSMEIEQSSISLINAGTACFNMGANTVDKEKQLDWINRALQCIDEVSSVVAWLELKRVQVRLMAKAEEIVRALYLKSDE